jgi:hypothetical protein
MLFFYDPFIDVPVASKSRAQMRCGIPSNITLFTASSHYHKRGSDYAAYVDPPSGPIATSPFYTSSDWDHPASLAAPLAIAAGSRLRFSCGYDNTTGTAEYFQGQSAQNNEMCMFTGLYYPALTLQDDMCLTTHDMFGTGSANCMSLLSCVRACPPNGISFSPGQANVDTCDQKCFVASCATASGKIIALDDCTQAHCKTECADTSSSACSMCVSSYCLTEYAACVNDACN